MKKIFVLFLMCAAMMACTGNSTKTTQEAVDPDSIVLVDSLDSAMIDTINIDFE